MSLWQPADRLLGQLNDQSTIETLPSCASQCFELAKHINSPCPASFIIVGTLILQIFNKFDDAALSERQNTALNELTDFLGRRLADACEQGDHLDWSGLNELWRKAIWGELPKIN